MHGVSLLPHTEKVKSFDVQRSTISLKLFSILIYLSAESVISTISSSCANKSQFIISEIKKLSGFS